MSREPRRQQEDSEQLDRGHGQILKKTLEAIPKREKGCVFLWSTTESFRFCCEGWLVCCVHEVRGACRQLEGRGTGVCGSCLSGPFADLREAHRSFWCPSLQNDKDEAFCRAPAPSRAFRAEAGMLRLGRLGICETTAPWLPKSALCVARHGPWLLGAALRRCRPGVHAAGLAPEHGHKKLLVPAESCRILQTPEFIGTCTAR